jgi:hypothetical protein
MKQVESRCLCSKRVIIFVDSLQVLMFPPFSTTPIRVWGQLGIYTSNTANNGGISANSLYAPHRVAVDASFNVYIADGFNSRVLYFPAGTTTATRVSDGEGDDAQRSSERTGWSIVRFRILIDC